MTITLDAHEDENIGILGGGLKWLTINFNYFYQCLEFPHRHMPTIFLITFDILNQIQNKLHITILHLIIYTVFKKNTFLIILMQVMLSTGTCTKIIGCSLFNKS